MSFTARYNGTCMVCRDEIDVGQQIEFAEESGYRHVYCVPRPPKRHGKVCPTCHMEMPLSGVCANCEEG